MEKNMQFQWYPGHMTKAKRQMQEDIKLIDLVIELVDARIPLASRNPDIDELGKNKARLILMNKSDLSDAGRNREWSDFFREKGYYVVCLDARSKAGMKDVTNVVMEACKEKIERDRRRGIKNRPVRTMVVGIPNVGKSTLMNLLSKSDVFAENKLFATLDTTVRKIAIKNVPFLLADTVGFIRKLPHHLVESFKSTLDEVREADVILHVVDISHPQFEDQMKVVNATLAELIKEPKPTIIIFNKIDAFHYVQKEEDDLTPVTRENYSLNDLKQMWMSRQGSETVYISAVKKENIEELKEKLYDIVKEIHSARFPYNDFLYQDYTENNPETEE